MVSLKHEECAKVLERVMLDASQKAVQSFIDRFRDSKEDVSLYRLKNVRASFFTTFNHMGLDVRLVEELDYDIPVSTPFEVDNA